MIRLNGLTEQDTDYLKQISEKTGDKEFMFSDVREIVPNHFFLKKMSIRKHLIQITKDNCKISTWKVSQNTLKKLTGGDA